MLRIPVWESPVSFVTSFLFFVLFSHPSLSLLCLSLRFVLKKYVCKAVESWEVQVILERTSNQPAAERKLWLALRGL